MTRADVGWLTFWTAAGVLFWQADRHDFALCSTVRRLFHAETLPGRIALSAALGTGALVLHQHLLNGVEKVSDFIDAS